MEKASPWKWTRRFSVLLTVVVFSLFGRTSRAAVFPLDAEQMVHLSEQIVVAVVESGQARWNEQRTLIVTDYSLHIEDRLRGDIPGQVTLTMPGGTLGGVTHETSVSVHLRTGSRYLLFCRDLRQPQMSPITGAFKGAFREIRSADGASTVVPGEGGGGPLVSAGKKLPFADFVEAVRELVHKTPAKAEGRSLPGWSASPANLPAKTYAGLTPQPDARFLRASMLPLKPADLRPPVPDGTTDNLGTQSQSGVTDGVRGISGNYVWERRPAPPVVFNQLPPSFTPWSPLDQHMMSYWNTYASVLFRVSQSPTGTWSWGNNVYDMAGFPSDADMVSQFGPGAAWGADVLAVTYYGWFDNGPIVEADIAFNPHFSWTTDEVFATQSTSFAYSYRQTVLHELGHSWGLHHPWETQRVWWDSVMNYSPKNFRLVRLFADDAAAVRSAYPGTSIHDGLLSAYRTDFGSGNSAFYVGSSPTPAFVSAGSSFQMTQPISIQNVGTDDLVNPVIEVYLTPQRLSFEGSIYLTTLRYIDTIHPFPDGSTHLFNTGVLTIPIDVPSGLYSVAFFLRDDSDGLQLNNSGWSDVFLQVQGNSNFSCTPSSNTLCIDDQPGDRRFKIEVTFSTQGGGGRSGSGTAIPLTSLGVTQGGLFWFFSANNPEMLLKVLNGCPVNGHYWIFTAAGTNVGLVITVTDTFNGSQLIYENIDGTAAVPIQDTTAFTCSTR